MAAIVSEKFHVHGAIQFVESLSEGVLPFSETVTSNGNTVIFSSNVFSRLRVDDVILANNEMRRVINVATNGTSATINVAFSNALSSQIFGVYSETPTNDTYYLLVGRSTPWSNGDSSNAVPTPHDSVANTTYAYWADGLALRRVTDRDVMHVVPRYDWANNTAYTMYDHRINLPQFVANVATGNSRPMYVLTNPEPTVYNVFKCIYDGRANTTAISNSVAMPTIDGQELVSDLTTAQGSPYNNYIWKYLYTIQPNNAFKFLTTEFMPVETLRGSLDANGDIADDGTGQYQVFHQARTTSNGGIFQIILNSGGTEYTQAPTVTVVGDGSGAEATAQMSGESIREITVNVPGENYTWARVEITSVDGEGTGANATAIISPRSVYSNTSGIYYRSTHGIDPVQDLSAKYVMLYAQLYGNESGVVTGTNEYRRIAIVKNPTLSTGQRAMGSVYDLTTKLVFSGTPVASMSASEFTKDELVFQSSSNAYGLVVEQTDTYLRVVRISAEPFTTTGLIVGVGNGNATSLMTLTGNVVTTAWPETLATPIAASGVTAALEDIVVSPIEPYSGEILYVDQRVPVVRSSDQVEVLRIVLEF